MLTSTTSARPRFLIKAERPAARRYTASPGDLSSPAGLHPKPWLERLRRAVRQESFVLHYQPIVSLADGEISHYEALVRLDDAPDGRLCPPAMFLPAAERYSLVQDIDRVVASKAIGLLAELRSMSSPRVAINLSALSITDGGMLAHIERELQARRVDPSMLMVELTETAAISNMTRASAFCGELRRLGCTVALDDFGAGFGSFQYLKHLPFDYLKIDGDFIRQLPVSHKDQLVVKAMVGLARGMGKRTIAEYVGDERTMSMLRGYGVDFAQGYHLGQPRGALETFARAA